MNNQKDTQKTSINSYGQSNVSDSKSLENIQAGLLDSHAYEFANKKTEKLVAALYLVSDCMETDDALKNKLRLLGVDLLSDIYKISTLSTVEKHSQISSSLVRISELVSFIEIAFTIGFISEMNTSILKKEFSILASDLKSNLDSSNHFTFTLDDKMFELPELPEIKENNNFKGPSYSGKSIGQINKRTSFNTLSFINNKSPLGQIPSKKTVSHVTNFNDKQVRIDKIISIIKDKKDFPSNREGVSIKDISLAFTDCSEKTIQRELNMLVQKNQLKKSGSKRWSRYSVN